MFVPVAALRDREPAYLAQFANRLTPKLNVLPLASLAQTSPSLFPVLMTLHDFWQGILRPLLRVRVVVLTPALQLCVVHVDVMPVSVAVPIPMPVG